MSSLRIRAAKPADLDAVIGLNTQAFNTPPSWQQRMREWFDPAHWRVAQDGASTVGVLRAFPLGHYYGGRAVPATGIASVAVAPEARGRGVATALMRAALAEKRAEGSPISSLYPATVPVYARLGYGFGGVRTRWKASLGDLPARANSSAVLEPFDPSSLDELMTAYEHFAITTNGLVARDREWWERRVLTAFEGPQYTYLTREHGEITGWMVYELTRPNAGEWRSVLSCRDLFWTTPNAARALLGLAAMHRSTCSGIEWVGPPVELLGNLTGEDSVEPEGSFRWMVRLLDVPAAIEARGYNPLAVARVTLRVEDPLFPENEGPWEIVVTDGRAKVARASEAEAVVDASACASIWTSLQSAHNAVRTGGLTATPEALEALGLIFAGPTPWIADFY
ncbi:MAG: GNAT family N-acetyltransferase [Actinomycetota bacterium]